MKLDLGCPFRKRKEIIDDIIIDTLSPRKSQFVFMCNHKDAPSYHCDIDVTSCSLNPQKKKP